VLRKKQHGDARLVGTLAVKHFLITSTIAGRSFPDLSRSGSQRIGPNRDSNVIVMAETAALVHQDFFNYISPALKKAFS
jgi:hypothetical protein